MEARNEQEKAEGGRIGRKRRIGRNKKERSGENEGLEETREKL